MVDHGYTLGILGGMGPAATAELLRLLALKSPATSDQEHFKIIVYSNPKTPDRTEHIIHNGPTPIPYLLEGLKTLDSWGADYLAVPCNTSHYFISQFPLFLRQKIVSIIEATLVKAEHNFSSGFLLATEGTINTELYQKEASKRGFRLFLPTSEQQEVINRVIYLVKKGELKESGLLLKEIVQAFPGAVLGYCTEIPLAFDSSGLPKDNFVSSLDALAEACIKIMYY